MFLEAIIDISERKDEISHLTDFSATFAGFIRVALFIAALVTMAYLIWGAVDWIMSGGDSGKVESARKKITHAILGLVILMSVGAIMLFVQGFLGIGVFQADGVLPKVTQGARSK